jgi:ElaB/YqjD/DUF883 family membrane-anchored ribosome-binding protein
MVNATRDIDDILDIEPISNPNNNKIVKRANQSLMEVRENFQEVFSSGDPRFEEDFEEVRENLKDVILEVNDNIKKLSMIAQDGEKASAFSALAQLITTLLNANKQLLEIYSEKKKYQESFNNGKQDGATYVQNNNYFTGTTEDLDNFLRQKEQELLQGKANS